MILEGKNLLFDTVDKNKDVFPKDCKIDIPEKVPLTLEFNHEKIIGFANVMKDDRGLVARSETFSKLREVALVSAPFNNECSLSIVKGDIE